MGKYTKEQAVSVIVKCAVLYQEHLANHNLLFLCMDKHRHLSVFEISFDGSNFLHLTGVKINRNGPSPVAGAKDFYDRCLNHRLSVRDFEFAKDGTTALKLDVLPQMMSKNISATMIGDYNTRSPKLLTEKLAGNVRACMGFVSVKSSVRYVPNTLLKTDIRQNTSGTLRIIATYRKKMDQPLYRELTYAAKDIDLLSLNFPKEYEYLKTLHDSQLTAV